MCGITGIVDIVSNRPIDRHLLKQMNDAQFHRGPDADGIHFETGVGLGHRRLSIIDLEGSQQPLYNEDQSIVVVYNGEIYNFQELTEELLSLGHKFRTHGDTEVIVHAWEQWGELCVEKFRGMFAFALWDSKREILFLARDRVGIKPLYYALLTDGHLIFGSELKSLLAHPHLPREINPQAVDDYFAYGYIPEPKTILSHAFKLPPGHILTVKRGQSLPVAKSYWDIPFELVTVTNEVDVIAELLHRMEEAVNIRLIADVPLGAFLSGGVDSSAVVAMMSKLCSEPVKTCSISFGDPHFNESEFAAQVAGRYQTNHTVKQVDSDDFSLLSILGGMYDEPFADSSALPTYIVCQLARQQVTVALSGDGGDENFAGYKRYFWQEQDEARRALLPFKLRRTLFGLLGNAYPKLPRAPRILRAKSTFESLACDNIEGYFKIISIFDKNTRHKLFSSSFLKSLQGYDAIGVLQEHAKRAPSDNSLSIIQYLDMKTYLPGDILTKVDRASMANSLEVRVPLLDHKLIEWISGLPPNLKLRGQEGKYIFKKALQSHLSHEILYRPKMGFAVPLANWFRGPLKGQVKESLLGSTIAESRIFNLGFLQKLFDQHQSGYQDHSASIWAIMMFDSFLKRL